MEWKREVVMRRYHFNLTDGVKLLIHETEELSGPRAARLHALALAKQLMAEKAVPEIYGWKIVVTDEASKHNFDIPVIENSPGITGL